MKKLLSLILAVLFIAAALTACGSKPEDISVDDIIESVLDAENTSEEDDADTAEPDTPSAGTAELVYNSVTATTDELGMTYAVVYAMIENKGDTTVEISDLAIDILDKNGEVLESPSLPGVYPSIIAPGERAYIGEFVSVTTEEVAAEAAITFTPEETESSYKYLSVCDYSLEEDELFGITVKGEVENTTGEAVDMGYVVCPIFKDGKLIGLPFTILDGEVAPDDVAEFEATELVGLPDADYSGATCEPFAYNYEWFF